MSQPRACRQTPLRFVRTHERQQALLIPTHVTSDFFQCCVIIHRPTLPPDERPCRMDIWDGLVLIQSKKSAFVQTPGSITLWRRQRQARQLRPTLHVDAQMLELDWNVPGSRTSIASHELQRRKIHWPGFKHKVIMFGSAYDPLERQVSVGAYQVEI